MATTNKFVNLDALVYSPISAIVEANNNIATNIIEQVEQVGYKVPNDNTQAIHLREMNLQYTKISTTDDNNNVLEDVAIKLPLLSIMSLNSLKVDTAKVVLDAEIELYSKTVRNQCLRARPINTSSTSPQVHIEINLKEGDTPEGMSKLLDVLNNAQVPKVVSSKLINNDGTDPSGIERMDYQKTTSIRKEQEELAKLELQLKDDLLIKKKMLDTAKDTTEAENMKQQIAEKELKLRQVETKRATLNNDLLELKMRRQLSND